MPWRLAVEPNVREIDRLYVFLQFFLTKMRDFVNTVNGINFICALSGDSEVVGERQAG